MRRLADRQGEFAAAVLDPRQPIPHGCVGPDRKCDEKRFAVYRNNVISSLIEALRDGFPAISRLVGEECFHEVARIYAARHPPVSPIMLEYGAEFPDFLAQFEELASLPYLRDVARIERAWLEAYHASEVLPLDLTLLAKVPQSRTGQIRFTLHPSLRIVRSAYPAIQIWRMNVADGVPGPIDLASGGEDALIVRPDSEVEVRALSVGAVEFLEALAKGGSLACATEGALGACETFDLAQHLAALLEGGVVVGYQLESDEA